MSDDISMSIDIRAPLERVWEAISTESRLRDWLNADLTIEPREGGSVTFPGVVGHEAYIYGGPIATFVPRRELTFEWNTIPVRWPNPALVTFTLEPQDDAVIVRLRVHGLARLETDAH